jgi:hypothetical protein
MSHTSYAVDIAEARLIIALQLAHLEEQRVTWDFTADTVAMWRHGMEVLRQAEHLLRQLEAREQHQYPP